MHHWHRMSSGEQGRFDEDRPALGRARVTTIARAADCCPRCSAPRGTLSLLTSMKRYYVCGRCRCQWQISRAEGAPSIRSRFLRVHGDVG